MSDLYLNEKFIGTVKNPKDFISKIKYERRSGKLPQELNVFYDENIDEIYVDSSRGRARRPLIIVEKGVSKLTDEINKELEEGKIQWQDLVDRNIVEYLDAAEEEDCYVALYEKELTKEHTHLEIIPSAILGITTSLVPYANFSQTPRLNRGSKTQKQALGLYASNYLVRMDTDVNILHYPQTPIVRSYMHDLSDYDSHPAGQNIVIALMSYEGYNMQDSIIVNKSSIERGFARSTFFRPYVSAELRYSGGLIDEIGIPDKDVKGYKSEKSYRLLEEDGFVSPEMKVEEEDVIIGKTSPPRFLGELEEFSLAANIKRESSSVVKHGESGIVDMVTITENDEGNKLVKARIRDQRIPEVGDKFASRHGQKGVIGAIVPAADLPFTASN